MSKNAPKIAVVDISNLCKSSFTLTFAVEVLGIDVWHDCNEGWLDLGPCAQGIKLQYQLYPGQTFEVDILIWPHVAKVGIINLISLLVYLEILFSKTPLSSLWLGENGGNFQLKKIYLFCRYGAELSSDGSERGNFWNEGS